MEKGEEASHLSQVDQLQLSTVVVQGDHKADLNFHLQTPETSSLLDRFQVSKVMSIRRPSQLEAIDAAEAGPLFSDD